MRKRHARKGRGIDRLQQLAPSSAQLLRRMGDRGVNIGSATLSLLRLLDAHGREMIEYGIREALSREVYHPHGVRHAITRRRENLDHRPLPPIHLPDDPRVRDATVIAHDLSTYGKETHHEEIRTQDGTGEETRP